MSYRIPLFDLRFSEEEQIAVTETLRSAWVSMGPKTAEVETEFAQFLGVPRTLAVTNCTAALHLAMLVLNLKPGDEVLVPSLTFVATVNAIRYVGATPVFVEPIGTHDFSIDPLDLQNKITERTRAIVVVHYAGFACPMQQISDLAKQHNLFIVEDAAHAPDALYKNHRLGTIGDLGCFSFYSNKNITCAEGGLLVARDPALLEHASLLRSHGMTTLSYERSRGHASSYDVVDLGFNYRIDDIRATLLLHQFHRLKADTVRRKEIRDLYLNKLSKIDGIDLPYFDFPHPSSNYIFPIVLQQSTAQKRDFIRESLAEDGIQTSVHYPAIHRFSSYQKFVKQALPKTEYLADNEITLPLHPFLTKDDIDYIAASLEKSLLKQRKLEH